MERPIIFFSMLFILLFVIIGFIVMVFDLSGVSFVFELGLLLAFMFFLAFAMFLFYHDKSGSLGLVGGVLILLLLNAGVIVLITGELGIAAIVTAIFSIAGLVVVALNVAEYKSQSEQSEEEHYNKPKYYHSVIGNTEPINDVQELKNELEEKSKSDIGHEHKVHAVFTPGKFVASMKAHKFHSPKCDWALRISKSNQVWFDSKEDAQSKGFEADKCVA